MNYQDIKYDLYAYLDTHLDTNEYCDDDCNGGELSSLYMNHQVDDNLEGTLTVHHFDALLGYIDCLPETLASQFINQYQATSSPFFSKTQVLTFGLLCQLDVSEMEELLRKVGYLIDEESKIDLVYLYFFESNIYQISLLKQALEDVEDGYGN